MAGGHRAVEEEPADRSDAAQQQDSGPDDGWSSHRGPAHQGGGEHHRE